MLDSHGGNQADVGVSGAVELFDNLNSLLGFGATVQPAVVQTLRHAVALQHVQQLAPKAQAVSEILHTKSINQRNTHILFWKFISIKKNPSELEVYLRTTQ